jgi:hypothetical protein
MDTLKAPDRRRNMMDIIADLGTRERKAPPPLTVVAAQPALPPPTNVAEALTEAQRRATEQRIAAERMLQESLELEQRLAEEAELARRAVDRVAQLSASVSAALLEEQKAAEHAELCARNLERATREKTEADALRADDQRILAEARRALEVATASCTESERRFTSACSTEEDARREAETSSQLLAARRNARKDLETELRALEPAAAPQSQSQSIEELRALEARRRIAERRAADLARTAS